MALRDRLLTRAGAQAITSPSAILLAGVGAATVIAVGWPIPAAAGAGAALWGARVAFALPRAPREPRIDPRRLANPWQTFVREALDAQVRYQRAIGNARAGPIRDRLTEIGRRVEDGVAECWRIAVQGHELQDALRQLEPAPELERRLELLRGREVPGTATASVAQSLRNQLRSTLRIAEVANDAADRLRVLDARLDEAVARAVELSLRAGSAGDLTGLESDVDALVADMEALRQALDETSGAARP